MMRQERPEQYVRGYSHIIDDNQSADSPQLSSLSDLLMERVDDAIEDAMAHHESLKNDSVCTCGVRNNMDGDVLFSHRFGVVSEAVRKILDPQ